MKGIRIFGLFVALFFFASIALPQAEDEIPVEIVRLSDRVLVLKEDVMNNNITAIASKKGLVIVDNSGFPGTARKMRGIIEREFKRTDFAFVINTHFHWDHAWGNQAFPEAMIIGHADCPAFMARDREYVVTRVQYFRQRLEEQKAKLGQADPNSAEAQNIRRSIGQTERDIREHSEGFVITPPQITFNDRMTWDLGDLTLKMYFFGRAHSGTDIFIHIPEEGILLTGDIFLDRRWLPLFAGEPELDIPKWIEVLHTVLDGPDKLTQVIPGHLDLWTPEKLDLWRDYIVDLWGGLQKARAEGLAFEAAAARLPLGERFNYLRENGHSDARIQEFHRGNLEAFWSQLVESAARLVQEAITASGTEAGLKKFAGLRSYKESYYFNERQFNLAGYSFLNSGRIDEAIAVFKMNVELFPGSWNVYDSLAEAYADKGETQLAIRNYERSIELNPDNQNAKDQLKSLKKDQSDQPEKSRVAQRIENVENGLLEFNPGAPPSQKKWTLAERMAYHQVPGVSIALIDNYEVDWVKAYGLLKAGRDAKVTPESIFQAASTTKMVTAALVLHFVEKGKLELDADVNTYLMSWQVPENEFTRQKKVSLRLLLTHQSGFPETNFPQDEKAGPPTLVQVLKGESPAQNKPAVVEYLPGSQWQYSNIGYVVLQQILEDVSDKPFTRLAREIIFEPLGMRSSTLAYPLDGEMQAREAMPHDEAGQAGQPALPPSALAQGGLLTTPEDLARLTIELMSAYQGRSSRLLSQKIVRQMFHKEVDIDPKIFGFPVGQGLGVMLMGEGKNFSFAHPGSNYPGTTCWLVGYPELGKGAVIMANGAKGDLLSLEILPAISNEYGWPQRQ
jgi:CubicO group peptidase (beta-lactamase class C family)/glyoxylase-like metal-dependent hydrolase (beta-lactamase superfamily II)